MSRRWLDIDDHVLLCRVRKSRLRFFYLFGIGDKYAFFLVREDRSREQGDTKS